MIRIGILALLLVTACETETDRQLAELRSELIRQQEELDRLSAFVDAQAQVLTICQTAIVEFTDYLVNTSTLGMLREANTQYERFTECTAAIAAFDVAVDERSRRRTNE